MTGAQPVIDAGVVRLRDFTAEDMALVVSGSSDPLIPLTTTVPTTPDATDAQAYIARQNTRLPYSRISEG